MGRRWSGRVVAAVPAALLTVGPGWAQQVPQAEPFYAGKSIQLVIGASEGGGFDIAARLVADYLSRHLPGNPRVVPQHMPGASGLRAAEYIYSLAAKDGTVIGHTQPSIVLHKVLDPSARFDPTAFTWIGRLNSFKTYAVAWHSAPALSIAETKSSEIVVGAVGTSGPGFMLGNALNRMTGTKLKLVLGYKSASEQGIAMERGEIHAIGSASWEYIEAKRWLPDGKARLLYTIGGERSGYAPELPTVVELVQDGRDKDAMRLMTSASDVGRAFIAPPGLPADRAKLLQDVFAAAMTDGDFVAEAKKRSIDIEYKSGPEMAAMVAGHLGMSADVVARTRDIAGARQ